MRPTKHLKAIVAAAILVGLIPGLASAKDNTIYQDYLSSNANGNDEFAVNEFEAKLGENNNAMTGLKGDGNEDVAYAVSNCQFLVAADVWILIHASTDALGVISDNDEVAITSKPPWKPRQDRTGAEEATSSCKAPIGPVSIHISTVAGWGAAAPHGMSSGGPSGSSGGGYSNTISQTNLAATATLDDVGVNDAEIDASVSDGAVAVANCQGLIVARLGVSVTAATTASGEIEDDDSIAITGAPDTVSTTSRPTLEVAKDSGKHTAHATCEQSIESIEITIGTQK